MGDKEQQVIVWHNPRCTKSRMAMEYLRAKGVEPQVIEYLKNPATREDLEEVIDLLGIRPIDLVRRGEQEFKDFFAGKELTDSEWIDAMLKYPKLIERPIVIKGQKAVIARPAERIDEL